MSERAATFSQRVQAVLSRYFGQTGRPVPAAGVLAEFAARLWTLVQERGVPPALPAGVRGEPAEMPAEVVAPLVERLLAGLDDAERAGLATPARQLVKTCFQGDFTSCRDSFREIAPDGTCRRQDLARVRERVSGAHCVDCPYWLLLTPEQHARFLARQWRAEADGGFAAHRGVFLPEDYRALRRSVRNLNRPE
jgi:hypothetical protein